VKLTVINLGLIDYDKAFRYQQEAVSQTIGDQEARLILCEHPAVVTLGRASHQENLLLSNEEFSKRNILLKTIDRGGDVTLHSPKQLVMYPLLELNHFGKELDLYMHRLEDVGIKALKSFHIDANRDKRNTGLWIGNEKIMAIGIGVKKWVSYHGIALNVNNDLSLFSVIRPCGMNFGVTSMSKNVGKSFDLDAVQKKVIDCFCEVFQLKCVL